MTGRDAPLRAIVIGAGPTGLATALALRHAGVDARVYERAPGPGARRGTGLTLWPNAFTALGWFGAAEAVHAAGTPCDAVAMSARSGRTLYAIPRSMMEERYGYSGVGLDRGDLIDVLLERLGRDAVSYGHRLTGLRDGADGVEAVFADGARAHGDLLVGADGIRSTVRARLGLGGAPHYAGFPVWRAVTRFPLDRAPGDLTLGPGAQFGLWAVPGGRAYWFASFRAPAGTRQGGAAGRAELAERFSGWHAPIPELIAATADEELIATDIYDLRPIPAWGRGRVTLAGDAAHPGPPNLGQGTCQAFEDATALADALAGAGPVDAALRSYERARKPRADAINAQARSMARAGAIRSTVVTWLVQRAIAAVPLRTQLAQLDPVFIATGARKPGEAPVALSGRRWNRTREDEERA